MVNPNNPTGTPIKQKDIIKILNKSKNTLVLVDEAYLQFTGNTSKGFIRKYKNLIVIQTFSKTFGLGGLRLGYAISNKDIIKNMQKAASPYSVNSAAVIAGSAALDDIDYVNKYVKEVNQSKKLIYSFLEKKNIPFFRSDANFILVKFGKKNKEVIKKLKQKKILIRDRSSYNLLSGCSRVTIGTGKQIKYLIKALKQILK